MLSSLLKEYLLANEIWFEKPNEVYRDAIKKHWPAINKDFLEFYSHADDGPSFLSPRGELVHMGWNLIYGSHVRTSEAVKKALGIPDHYVLLDSFQGSGGYIYNINNNQVWDYKIGGCNEKILRDGERLAWGSFSDFLEFFWGLGGLQK